MVRFFDFYEGQLSHKGKAHAQHYVALFAKVSTQKNSIILLNQISRFEADSFNIMKADQRLYGEVNAEYYIRLIKVANIWQFLVMMNLAESIATDIAHMKTFLMKTITKSNTLNHIAIILI